MQKRVNVGKKGIRSLGIAESFRKEIGGKAVLAGVVMRSDLLIDGVTVTTCTVGGLDSTDKLITMWQSIQREDINVIILSGSVISWFNVVDLKRLQQAVNTPLICISYRESDGLDKVFQKYFPEDWMKRLEIHRSNGERQVVTLKTGYKLYIRNVGIELEIAKQLLDKFTLEGRYPEPVRIAKLVARSILALL